MSLFKTPAPIVVTCHKRLAPYVEREVTELGFPVRNTFVTGVNTQGTLTDCIRLNLNLFCASQILYSLGSFQARHPDDVYRFVHSMPWEDILPEDGYFSITSNVQTETVNNNMFVNVRVKDGIVDRFREEKGNQAIERLGYEWSGAAFVLER